MRTGLVYHAGALGDLIVATPAIEHWAAAERVDRLVLAGRGAHGELLCAAGIVAERWDAEAGWFARAYRGAPPELPEPVHAALAFTQPGGPVEQALISAVAGPLRVVRPVPGDRRPIVRHHLDAVGAGPEGVRAPALRLPAAGARRMDAQRTGRSAAIAPGSGSPSKNWPLDRFAAVAAALRPDATIVWLLGPAEEELHPPTAPGDLILRGRPIVETAAALCTCTLLLGNDSGLAHLGAALSVPVVALFAASDAAVWAPAPAAAPVMVVTPHAVLPARRCGSLPAPAADATMQQIGVDPVLSACLSLLGK